MLQSKSFALVYKKKRQRANFRCNNPRRHLSTFLVLLGLAGFISWFIMANIPSDENKKSNTQARVLIGFDMWRNVQENNNSCTNTGGIWCTIICSDGEISEVSSFLQKQSSCGQSFLYLNNIYFPNSSMTKKWLNASFVIDKLFLNNPHLEAIEEDAFHGENFQKLVELEIINASIHYLSKSSLAHLKSLKWLKLAGSVAELSSDYLKDVSNTLTSLQINGIPEKKSPTDLIGNISLKKIVSLHLRNNNFGDTIDEYTFQNVESTLNIYLTGCQITSLGENSFNLVKPVSKFQLLDLRNNSLKVIQAAMLEHLINIGSIVLEIQLSGNPWDCTYKLFPLAQLIKKEKNKFKDIVKCFSPPELYGETLVPEILPITPSTTTTSTSTTETPTTSIDSSSTIQSSTKSPTSTTTELPCPDDYSSLTKIGCGWNENHGCLSSEINDVGVTKIYIFIMKISTGSVQITVDSYEIDQNLTIVWFSDPAADIQKIHTNNRKYCLGCASLQTKVYIINNLKLNKVYTFCVMDTNASQISPLNCRSHFVEEDWCVDIWILEESQSVIIIFSVISILITILLGAVTMFCVIRCNPDILKGQKRVVVLKRKTVDILVSPQFINVNKSVTDENLSLDSENSDLPMRKRSADSTASGRSYMIPDCKIILSQKSVTLRKDSIYFERLPEHSPPPLPKRLSSENTAEDGMRCSKLQLSDVAENDDYFVPYSGV